MCARAHRTSVIAGLRMSNLGPPRALVEVTMKIVEAGKVTGPVLKEKLIQGSAAHQTKMALVALDAENFPLQLTVHDEFWAKSRVTLS